MITGLGDINQFANTPIFLLLSFSISMNDEVFLFRCLPLFIEFIQTDDSCIVVDGGGYDSDSWWWL